ncbi:outer membrane protein [Acidimangrovimonas sediminis]|uniref:outer membrane protein n=1 Tax=Acidimangrovimonas sediminis TaxID=2056283 RepID=UPI001304D0F7|nr:outer membrane beta-barrel protein [Acidimangrovimonas sediminis]
MKKFVAISATTILMGSTAAFAGGMAEPVQPAAPVVVTPPAPAMPNWTGFYGGVNLGFGHTKADGNGSHGGSGSLGGVQLGYLQDMGSWVYGGQIAYDQSNMDLSGTASKVKNYTTIEGKIGPKYGRGFYYLALGVGSINADIMGDSHSDTGYFGGIGMDYMLANNWSVGGQILTGRYGDVDHTGVTLKPTTAQIDVSYHF